MASLRDILKSYNYDVLKALGHELGVTGVRKAPLIRELVQTIGAGKYVEHTAANLSPPERQVLGILQAIGGESYTPALKSRMLREELVKPTPTGKRSWAGGFYVSRYEGTPNYRGKPSFEDLIARLTKRGLVLSRAPLPDRKLIGWTPGQFIFIPRPIRPRLPEFPQPDLTSLSITGEPAQILSGSSRAFQRDLGRYWRYIRRAGELRITTQGYVYKADLKAINKNLSVVGDLRAGKGEGDNGRLHFIRRLLPALKVVKYDELGNLQPILETPFWGLPPSERVKRTFEAWRDGTGWNELLHLPLKVRGYHHNFPAWAKLTEVRTKVLNHLKQGGGRGWISLNLLTDRIRLADYGFLFPNRYHKSYTSYYGYSNYGTIRTTPYYEGNNPFGITFDATKVNNEAEGWEQVEASLITHIVAGPLYWMGLVDLGYPSNVQPDPINPPKPEAFRLTSLGAWILGLGKEVTIHDEGGRVVVQPNFQILAMEPISDEVLITLDHFSDSEMGGDRVMSYKLSRQSVYKGQQDGWDVPRIIEYLEKASGTPLPGNVRRSLEEWQTLHERIVFRRGVTLLQAADRETLDQLLEDSKLAQTLGQRVAENVTLPPGDVSQVAKALRKRGWLPLVTQSTDRNAPNSLQADEDGRLRFVLAAPSIYALGKVAPFTEMVEGTHQITSKAVQKALTHRETTVDSILEALQSVHIGKLPHKLVIDIKAWGEYYGNAKMNTLTLIQFRDHDALRELLTDPDLSSFLTPFEAGPRALAIVDREHIEDVQRLLAERGVRIQWNLK